MQRLTRFSTAFFLVILGASAFGWGSMSGALPAGAAAALFAVYFVAVVLVIGVLLPRPNPPTPPART